MAQGGFNKLVADAHATEGSVFDTWTDTALRMGTGDSWGGLGPQAPLAGVVRGGAQAAPWLQRMARRIAGNRGSADDLIQAAYEAVQKEGGTLNPRNAMRGAKSAMLNARSAGGTGARSETARALAKAQGTIGENAGELRLWAETNKHLTKPIPLDRFRKVRGQIREPDASLDIAIGEGNATLADTVRGMESPESRAIMREGIRRLTPQQQTNLLKRLQGEDVNPAILQRLKKKLTGGPERELPPISGGAGTPNLMLNPRMQEIQGQLKHFLDRTFPEGAVKKGWQSGTESASKMAGVRNPYHPEFVRLQDQAPKVARALQLRGGDGLVEFQDLHRGAFRHGAKEAWGRTSGLKDPIRGIAYNPANPGPESTTIHEPLHALYQLTRNQDFPADQVGRQITLYPGRMTPQGTFPKGKETAHGLKLLENMYSGEGEAGHAAIERLTNNILQSLGRPGVYRKF